MKLFATQGRFPSRCRYFGKNWYYRNILLSQESNIPKILIIMEIWRKSLLGLGAYDDNFYYYSLQVVIKQSLNSFS